MKREILEHPHKDDSHEQREHDLLLVLTDEIARRDNTAAELRASEARLDPAMRRERRARRQTTGDCIARGSTFLERGSTEPVGVEYRHYLLPVDRTFAPDAERVARLVEALRRERWVLTPDNPSFASHLGQRVAVPPYLGTGGYLLEPGASGGRRLFRTAEIATPIPLPMTPEWLSALRPGGAAPVLQDELALVFPLNVPDDTFVSFVEMDLLYPFTFGQDEALYHDVVIHLARDFVDHTSECTDPIDTRCRCGVELAYNPDEYQLRLAIRFESRIHARCPSCGAMFEPNGRLAERRDSYSNAPLPPLAGGGVYRFAVIVDCAKGWPRDRGALAIAPAFAQLVASVIGQPIVDFGEFYRSASRPRGRDDDHSLNRAARTTPPRRRPRLPSRAMWQRGPGRARPPIAGTRGARRSSAAPSPRLRGRT